MLESIIRFSISQRWLVLAVVFGLAALGIYNFNRLPIDAVPDITNVQVQINTEAPGYSPLETEQRITFPVETAISGLPDLDYTRSVSRYGLSQVTVIFDDGTDIYRARQLVSERIQSVRATLPEGVSPELGPIATGLGEIYMYILSAEPGALTEDGARYTAMDLLEARLHVFPKDAGKVKTGQSVRMGVAGSDLEFASEITRFLPISGENTQTRIAVASVPIEAEMTPGMRVMASVVTGESEVPLAVRESGLQSFRDFTVVYAKVGETYEVRMLDLGESDGEFVEVLGGLDPGTEYVSANSFLIKADIEKSGASHDH